MWKPLIMFRGFPSQFPVKISIYDLLWQVVDTSSRGAPQATSPMALRATKASWSPAWVCTLNITEPFVVRDDV